MSKDKIETLETFPKPGELSRVKKISLDDEEAEFSRLAYIKSLKKVENEEKFLSLQIGRPSFLSPDFRYEELPDLITALEGKDNNYFFINILFQFHLYRKKNYKSKYRGKSKARKKIDEHQDAVEYMNKIKDDPSIANRDQARMGIGEGAVIFNDIVDREIEGIIQIGKSAGNPCSICKIPPNESILYKVKINEEDFYEICNLCIDKLNIEGFRKI